MKNLNFLTSSGTPGWGSTQLKTTLRVGKDSLLTSLRSILLIFAFLLGVGNVWGAIVSGTAYNINSNNTPEGWATNGSASSNYRYLSYSTNYILTDEFCQDGFSSIILYARTYNSPSNAQKVITVEWIDSESSTATVLGTVSPGSNSLANCTITVAAAKNTAIGSSTTGKIKISCKSASSNKGSGVGRVTINYTSCPSCDPPSTALSISSANTATVGTPLTLTTNGGNNGEITWSVTNGTGEATVSGSTLSPTKAGTVTVTATQATNGDVCGASPSQTITISKAAATITLSDANGTNSVSGAHYGGDSYTTPTTAAACTGKTFVGWSTVEIPDEGDKPNINYYDKGTAAILAAGTNTFYAVYATATEGGGDVTDVIDKALVDAEDANIASGSNGTWKTITVAGSNSGANYFIRTMCRNNVNTYAVRWNTNGYLYCSTAPTSGLKLKSVTVKTLANKDLNIYASTAKYSAQATATSLGTLSATTSGATFSLTTAQLANNYTCVAINGAASSTEIVSISITYSGSTSYSDYTTSCCTPLVSINGSVSLTQTTATVTWDKLANVGTWAVTYKADGGSESSANVTISDKDASHKQAVITGLIPSTHYTFYVTASNATGYCETSKTWSDVNGTTNAPYSITYKDKGNVTFSGTHASGYPTTHVYGTATTLKGATKTGYDFDGWFTAQDCSGSAITEISASQNANITLYAKWTAHQHTLTWDFNGGGTSSSSYTTGGTKDYGSAITYPADNTMSKVGYTFASWSSSATTMPDADLTITANWSPATNTAYTVKHYKQNLAGDGYDLADTDNLYGTTAANVTPDRKNYEGFTTPGGQLVTILADGTLVVEYQYTRNSYTLTWTTDGDALEGEYTGKSGKVKYGATITAPNEPTKTNFTFNGWSPAIAATMPAEDTEYTATWIANTHTITYDGNGADGGTTPVDNVAHAHGSTTKTLLNTFTKTYYDWDSWNTQSNGQGAEYDQNDNITVNDDITLYAIWNCIQEVNVGKGTPSHGSFTLSQDGYLQTCGEDGVVVTVTPSPATGYQFSEVTESGKGTVDGTTVTYAQYASGNSTINVTFTAKTSTITWNLNYTGAHDPIVDTYTYDGSTVSLPAPTRTGYTLAGWFTEETGGSQITNVGGTNKPTGNVEYYAHWNVNNYSVTWMVAGDEWSDKGGQSLVAYGSHVETLPTPPDLSKDEGCGDKFMGWTDATGGAYVHGTSNLYTTASQFPVAGTAGQTFYAVFADYVEK